jgi:hypothetical protein
MQLRRFSLYANADKCRFFTEEVDFLGFIVGRNGICIDPKQVKTIAQ